MSKAIYDPNVIEIKWQQFWEEQNLFQSSQNQEVLSPDEAMYLLFAFAYPSGSGLHVGHVESKTALDILARYYRMKGKKVFFPVGWDAFGLPAENYAIKTGIPPAQTTKTAIKTFRRQLKRIGISYDWENEIATCHPEYYKWTQWIFLQLFNKGLAYQKLGAVNWCPQDQTVLANEQVVNGECERCGATVIQKQLKQWYFKITDYKDELISGLDTVDWPEATKQQQLNWIGKGKGLSIHFTLKDSGTKLTVWTKFWETIYGTTFLVIAPEKFEEMNLLEIAPEKYRAAIIAYLEQTKKKTEEERRIGEKNKTGVDTGLLVTNPVNGESVPLFIADYVLLGVGTAIVMGVPAHDKRDFDFAKKFNLPIKQVVAYTDEELNKRVKNGDVAIEDEGVLVNSGTFDGQHAWGEGKENMATWMIEHAYAEWKTTYKLRDWLISRQRYWGAPIPIVYDPEGKAHPVKEEHLPWMLPTDVDFKPTGESPLKSSKEFKERVEKLYGKGWTPEYDTMDTFVDSSWYFMRYVDSRNSDMFASPEQLKKWLPVDLYMIGPEHIVLHLLYARFFTKFLRDEGHLQFDEPFMKMRHQGMILGPDGKKMSKSKGNVINPDDIIEKFGADTLRMYEMFMGPLEADKPWSTTAVAGVYRFLVRVHALVTGSISQNVESRTLNVGADSPVHSPQSTIHTQLERKLHQTIRKVTQDIPELKFNTAIATLMEFVNAWEAGSQGHSVSGTVTQETQRPKDRSLPLLSGEEVCSFVKLLAPFAPFLADELYSLVTGSLGHWDVDSANTQETKRPKDPKTTVHESSWPSWDEAKATDESIKLGVQVNGKVRAEITIPFDKKDDKDYVIDIALKDENIIKWLDGKETKKQIYVPGKIVSLVI